VHDVSGVTIVMAPCSRPLPAALSSERVAHSDAGFDSQRVRGRFVAKS
jgi:hypothetical protein